MLGVYSVLVWFGVRYLAPVVQIQIAIALGLALGLARFGSAFFLQGPCGDTCGNSLTF